MDGNNSGGRPRGDIRHVLVQAASQHKSGATWRELAASTQVGFTAARQTIQDMRRAGELVVIGTVRVKHSRRPMALYAPAGAAPAETGLELQSWMHGLAVAGRSDRGV